MYVHNDANAIYTRMVLSEVKNARMRWAQRLAKKYEFASVS